MLAIVIPFYKIKFFENVLQSLRHQTNKNFNVYIGNDASPEDPDALIESFQEDIRIKYEKFDENLGDTSLTKQWERCIGLTENEKWLMVLCDDDLLSSNVVEKFYSSLEKIELYDCKVVKYATQIIDDSGNLISEKFFHPEVQDYEEVFYSRFFKGSRSSLSEHIFNKAQYERFGFRNFDLAWHADDFAWLEFSEFGKIYSINDALVYFRLSEINISRQSYLQQQKIETRYLFFTIIIEGYLNRFNKDYALRILKKYELMTYKLNKGSIAFWFKFYPFIYKYFGAIEVVKFSRRIFLNRK